LPAYVSVCVSGGSGGLRGGGPVWTLQDGAPPPGEAASSSAAVPAPLRRRSYDAYGMTVVEAASQGGCECVCVCVWWDGCSLGAAGRTPGMRCR
jgi:hypothetical protein